MQLEGSAPSPSLGPGCAVVLWGISGLGGTQDQSDLYSDSLTFTRTTDTTDWEQTTPGVVPNVCPRTNKYKHTEYTHMHTHTHKSVYSNSSLTSKNINTHIAYDLEQDCLCVGR